MSTMLIDGAPADVTISSTATVREAFEILRDQVVANGRIVAEVIVNGQSIVWGDGNPLWERPVEPDVQIEIQSDSALRMALSLLDRIKEQMPIFAANHRRVAEQLRSGAGQETVTSIADLLSVWKDVHEGTSQICVLHGIDYTQSQWNDVGQLLLPVTGKLTNQLNQLNESLTLQDMVLTADLLEYELAPLAEQWQEVCDRLGDLLQKHFSKEGESQP